MTGGGLARGVAASRRGGLLGSQPAIRGLTMGGGGGILWGLKLLGSQKTGNSLVVKG
ncbi:MAG: hypothetical protein MJE68_01695 [Proteobacteria bacterium]|nr:hypothetical protein [Pseudomonadota bacterium]